MKNVELIEFLKKHITPELKAGDELRFLSEGDDIYVQVFRRKCYAVGEDEKVFGAQRYLTFDLRHFLSNSSAPEIQKIEKAQELYSLICCYIEQAVADYENMRNEVLRRKNQIVVIQI